MLTVLNDHQLKLSVPAYPALPDMIPGSAGARIGWGTAADAAAVLLCSLLRRRCLFLFFADGGIIDHALRDVMSRVQVFNLTVAAL